MRNSFFLKPSVNYYPQRIKGIIITEAITGAAITVWLNYLWYKKFPRTSFHFFNDNNEWLSMDKVGHATTAYNISFAQNDMLRWAGVKSGRAAFIGSFSALAFITMIEIMDGHSVKWGFSKGDMLANIVGCLFFDGQQLLWGQQRISLKYSYHATIFPHYNPGELGKNLQEKMLKDYNGQTYWLSLNIGSFLPQISQFPKCLNRSAGYGAKGMIGAVNNPKEINGKAVSPFDRYRQFYLAFDADLYRIKGITSFTTTAFKLNRFIKKPAPAFEWNTLPKGQFHWFYF